MSTLTIPDTLRRHSLPSIENIVGKHFTFYCGPAMYSGKITGISIAHNNTTEDSAIALEISNKHFWQRKPGVILTERYNILYLQFGSYEGPFLIYQTARYLPQGKFSTDEACGVGISFFTIIN